MGKLGSFLRGVIFTLISAHIFKTLKQSIIIIHRRLRRNHRAPIMVLSNHGFEQFQEIPIFSAHIWKWHHSGTWGSGTLKTPKKVDPLVVLTTQLLTRNQNISAQFVNLPQLVNLISFVIS